MHTAIQQSSGLGVQRTAGPTCWKGIPVCSRPWAKGASWSCHRTPSWDAPVHMRTATLDAPTGTADAKPEAPPATATEHERTSRPYSWTKQWWPVFPVFQLDKQKPQPVTLLGKEYVIWWDEAASQWSVLEDRCPHRLAQLSAGRIIDGQLMCSYHGWQFDGSGSCVSIPQIGDARAAESALSSSRTCVSSFPTRVEDGLLFAWLDSSPGAAAEAKAAEKTIVSQHVSGDAAISPTWISNTVPNDYIFWLEQGMDPSHAPYLHHGLAGFKMTGAVPLEGDTVPIGHGTDILKGFVWQHGAYDLNTSNMTATREFMAPHSVITQYVIPPKRDDKKGRNKYTHFQTFVVPVTPGVCRTFFKFGLGKHPDSLPNKVAGIISKLPFGLLHVLLNSQSRLGDQDISIMNGQETSMRKAHLTRRDYNLFARADEGIKALHEFFKQAKYEEMWEQRMSGGAAAWQPHSLEQQLSRWDRHTKDCTVCQKEYGRLTKVCSVLNSVGIALGAIAVALIAASHGSDLRAVAIAAVSALCLLGRGKLAEWRDSALISSAKQWRAVGGLSLVEGVPIQL